MTSTAYDDQFAPDPDGVMTDPMNAEAVAIEWPRVIWAKERAEFDVTGEHVFSVHATVARWEGDREGEFHRYVDGDTMDSLQRYHDTMIADLRAQLAAMTEVHAAAVARVVRLTDAAAHVLHDIDELAANSEGVAGLHMNGNVAEWSEIMDGGAFGAWLCSAEVLRAIIAEGTPT